MNPRERQVEMFLRRLLVRRDGLREAVPTKMATSTGSPTWVRCQPDRPRRTRAKLRRVNFFLQSDAISFPGRPICVVLFCFVIATQIPATLPP